MTYEQLVQKRKDYEKEMTGFINPSKTNIYDDGCYLEPWAKWHKSIPADIMLVGQDWGDVSYYLKNEGKDNNENATCVNLVKLFKALDIDIGKPNDPALRHDLHFTNIIPFIRTGKMQGSLDKIINYEVVIQFADEFIKPLIEMVKPKIIITLGTLPYIGVQSIFKNPVPKIITLKTLVQQGPVELEKNLLLFPMFHCGARGVNINRKLLDQQDDWRKIRPYLKDIS